MLSCIKCLKIVSASEPTMCICLFVVVTPEHRTFLPSSKGGVDAQIMMLKQEGGERVQSTNKIGALCNLKR